MFVDSDCIELYRLSYLNGLGMPYSLEYDNLTDCVKRLRLAYSQGFDALKIETLQVNRYNLEVLEIELLIAVH